MILLLFSVFVLVIFIKCKYFTSSNSMSQTAGTSAGQTVITNLSQDSSNLLQCSQCSQPRFFKGKKGLNIHIGKTHNKSTSHSQVTHLSNIHNVSSTFSNTSSIPLWQSLAHYKSSVSIVKRIPKGARLTVAYNLSTRIKKVVKDNSDEAWADLFCFSFQILHSEGKGNISLTSSIKKNCLQTDSQLLSSPQIIHLPQFHHSTHNIIKKIESKVCDGDLKGASKLLFSSDVLAPDTPETLAALLDKHPPAPTPITSFQSDQSEQPIQATINDVLAAIMSFRSGSAGGVDGLSPQHIKDLIGVPGDTGRALLNDITALINLMLTGMVLSNVTHILYGANLCALKKKDGGIRPIAVGSTFRRIASKICCKKILPKLTKKFQPLQLGFGSRGGCEAAVHGLRTFVNNDAGEVLLKVDVKNAFNSVDRNVLLREIQNCTPEIFDYLIQCYGSDSTLIHKTHRISSATGCQQGDPLGPAIFSLAIHPTISSLASKFNTWYLDDGTLGGDAETVLDDLKILIEKFHDIGLDLNFSKCELYIADSVSAMFRENITKKFNILAPNIKILNNRSLRLLGAPILKDSFPSYISEQQTKFEEYSERLAKINCHIAFHIIRFCLFVPQFTYVLRCSPLWLFNDLLSNLDTVLKNVLIQILNCPISDNSWRQASLPIRLGGIGIRKLSSVSLPAFLSSIHSTAALFSKIIHRSLGSIKIDSMDEAKNAWSLVSPNESFPEKPVFQRHWDEPMCKKIQKDLLDSASSPEERARLLASSTRESGFWLHALPSANIGTLLDNLSFSIAVSLRIGARTNEPHQCHCGSAVDRLGHHGLSCRRSAGRQSRHASLNDIIRRALSTVNVPAILEPNGIARDDGKRPDGMSLIPWSRGRPLVWDATCVDTLAASHVSSTSRSAGAAASSAENLKRRKYASIGDGYIFLPFAVETLGPWGNDAWLLFREISKRLMDQTNDKRAGAYLGQKISIAIQRGNVASLLGTLPAVGDLNAVFYL